MRSKADRHYKSPLKRGVLIVGFTIAALVILTFLFRGWVRMTAVPKTLGATTGKSVQTIYDAEMARLQNPLGLLGYTSNEYEAKKCMTIYAKGLTAQVLCSHDVRAYRVLQQTQSSKAELNANAKKLQNLLKANGWQGEYSDNSELTSLTKLVGSLTSGIDYQPDASYEKLVGNVHCFFHSNTAYSKPRPAAIATQASCERTFNIFGEPSYGSVKAVTGPGYL